MAHDPPHVSLSSGGTFNPPRDWPAFECLIRDLYQRLLGDIDADLHGRSGQRQSGVDVIGVDRNTGERVGIQCKGRNDGDVNAARRLTGKELKEEVEKARSFAPPLDRFILLTTARNDAGLQRVARELTEVHRAEGLFSVECHGWDWIEARLREQPGLAVTYGLIAVSHPPAAEAPISRIAREIGARLDRALELMNAGREGDDHFTLQGLARHARHKDWRRLEKIADGSADADEAELATLAAMMGLNLEWLLEGKGAPFFTDADRSWSEVEDLYRDIMALKPERIFFVRQRAGGNGHHSAFIVAKCNAVRWQVFRDTHPACDQVGSTGAWQLFDLCRLLRKFDYADIEDRVVCFGMHLDSPAFDQLLEGEAYPGTILRYPRGDQWWQAFSALRPDWIKGEASHLDRLRKAIHIASRQLKRAREAAAANSRWAEALAWGHFRLTAPTDSDGDVEPWT